MHNGFIKLWRKFTETSFYKSPNTAHLAVHLLLDCNHEPKKFIFNGKEEVCDRGQTVTGLLALNMATGISIQSLRTSLEILENTGFLTSKVTNRFRVISICKYNEYQDKPTSKLTISQQSTNNQLTTNNNDKNDKNTTKRFIKPTVQEIIAYCKERGNGIDGQHFFNSNEAKGWVTGKLCSPIKDWKAVIHTWEKYAKDRKQASLTPDQMDIIARKEAEAKARQ